jgi:hypothetical protein
MTALHPDPDPRTPDGWDDLWDPRAREWVERPSPPPRPPLIPLFLAAVAGAVMASLVWAAVTHAGPVSPTLPDPSFEPVELAQPPSAPALLVTPAPTATPTPKPTPTPVGLGHVVRGTASYCAPTPKYCQSWGGTARLAAVPTFHYGDRRYTIVVCRADDRSRCTTAIVVSYCACGDKVVDLSPYAFARLAPLSRGVVTVTVRW